ncbi:MAG: hypothetical protein F4W90_11895 [Gammaproteobacteria bacterium]|nr:hypothetical protein [Gammaproteobacteria bacterium]
MFIAFFEHLRAHANAWIIGTTIVFCTVVATVLTFLNGAVWMNYVVSYTIGVTCMSTQMFAHRHRPQGWNREAITVIAGIVGLVIALALGGTLGAFDPLYFFRVDMTGFVVGGAACFVACFLILLMGYIRDLEEQRDAARRDELDKERALAIAQLRTLQAQIEPHFLFNTLANLQSLITANPGLAKELLDALTQLFRVSLTYSRSTMGSIKEEMELVANYLNVQQIRLGERLHYDIQVQADLNEVELPPFIVQPLVENAIKHGIESASDAGQVLVDVHTEDATLRIQVTNSGNGISDEANAVGMGLANVRERIQSVYGSEAQLTIESITPTKTCVGLIIPFEAAGS